MCRLVMNLCVVSSSCVAVRLVCASSCYQYDVLLGGAFKIVPC